MTNHDEPTGSDYLWDDSGEPDPEVLKLRSALAPLAHSAPLARIHRRRGLGSALIGLVAAVLIFAVLPATQVPSRLAGLFYDDFPGEIGVKGGAMVEYRVAGGEDDPELTQRVADQLAARGADVVFTKPGLIVVELPGLDEARARGWSAGMGTRGHLEVSKVVSGSDYMRRLAAHVAHDERARALSIASALDIWSNLATGERHQDDYLVGPDRAALETYLAGLEPALRPEPKRAIALEALPATSDRPSRWRTYYISDASQLDERDIADAQPLENPQTGRPEVYVVLTADGTEKFARLTREMIGEKLAILVDGTVHAAPIVQGEITGGRVSITLGEQDPAQLASAAAGLAAALRSGPLPAPTEIASLNMVAPTITGAKLFLARALFATALGGIVFLLLFAAERAAPPIDPEVRESKRRRRRWKTLAHAAVTLAGFATVLLAARMIDGRLNTALVDAALFDALGACVMPVLTAFVLVEFAIALVPRWRHLRFGGLRDRFRLHVAAAILALPVAGLFGLFVENQVTRLSHLGMVTVEPFSISFIAPAILAGAVALIAIAELSSRYGLGNGYAVVILAAIASLTLWMGDHRSALWHGPVSASDLAIYVVAAAACAAATSWALRTRIWARGGSASVRLPTCGMLPILVPGLVWTALAYAGSSLLDGWPNLYLDTTAHVLFHGAAWVGLALLVSWLGWRAHERAPAARVVNGVETSSLRRARWWAAWASTVYILAVGGISLVATLSGAVLYLDAVAIVLATAIVMDLVAEWRARWRNPDLAAVWPVHDPSSVDLSVHALTANGIDVHTRGLYLRSMLLFLGPFAPVTLMVPRKRVREAETILETVFAPPARP